MKRLLVTGPRQAEFEDAELPACQQDGVLVRARLTTISTGTELRVFRAIAVDAEGRFLHERVPFALPAENGYSMVGEVVEVGSQVEGIRVGERVFAAAPHKQFAAVPATRVTRLPDSVPDEEAVMLNILEVAHRALRQAAAPLGADVAIVGQGVVGLSLLAYCAAFGCRTAALDIRRERLDVAARIGCCLALSPLEDDAVERVNVLFDGEGADVSFEAASSWSAVRTAMQVTRADGKVVIVSRHTRVPEFNPAGHPFLGKRLNLLTSYDYPPAGNRWSRDRSLALTLDLLARRKLRISPMLTHRFSWQQLPDIYRRMDQGEPGMLAVIVQWD